jgi:hypothetical protein
MVEILKDYVDFSLVEAEFLEVWIWKQIKYII